MILHTKALVLATRSYDEADKIVTFYTLESGKLKGIAKGAQRSLIRFVNKLEIFSLLEIGYEPGKQSSLVRIDQAELLRPFPALRQNYPAFLTASLLTELTQEWTHEHDPDPNIFSLLLWGLHTIDRAGAQGDPPLTAAIFFELKLLDLLGYRPNLDGCQRCGSKAPNERHYHFSLAASGLLCPQCDPDRRHRLAPLSLATVRSLAKAQELSTEKLARLQLPASGAQEACNFLNHYTRHLLQREIHSRNLINSLCQANT